MRLENYAVAAFEAWTADDAPAQQAAPAALTELPPVAVTETPSTVLSDMARLPLPSMPVAAPMATPAPVAAPANEQGPDAAIPVADPGAADRSGDAALIAHQDDCRRSR